MSEKTIRNLAVALFIMLALYGLLKWQQNRSYEPLKPKGFNFKKITKKTTKDIKVKSASGMYQLMLKSGKWLINDTEVAEAEIDALFDGLKEAEAIEVAATKEAKFVELEVDDENGKLVTFNTTKGEQEFIIGKAGSDGNSFYVRRKKDKKAYIARGSLGTVFAKNIDDWYDKEILSLVQDDIEKISFNYSDSEFKLIKDKKQWYVSEGDAKEKADTNKIDSLLGTMTMLNASKVVSQNENIDFVSSDEIIIYGKKDKVLASLKLRSKDKKNFYVKNSKKKYRYIIDEITAKNIRKKAKDLK